MGANENATTLAIGRPAAKIAYTLGDLEDLGIMSRTQAYSENRAGHLTLRKIGRRTIVLHEDLANWLQNLPVKNAVSQQHRELALRRWGKQ